MRLRRSKKVIQPPQPIVGGLLAPEEAVDFCAAGNLDDPLAQAHEKTRCRQG